MTTQLSNSEGLSVMPAFVAKYRRKLLCVAAAIVAMIAVTNAQAQSGTCGANCTWSYSAGLQTLIISGSGAMTNYTFENHAPWYSYDVRITHVVISGVTTIGDYAFYNCELTSVIIPNFVTSIGNCAFMGCYLLSSVTIGSGVTSIGDVVFGWGTSSLREIIVDGANSTYTSLDGVLFNKNKTTLIRYPAGKTDTSYTIPNSVNSISDYAFEFCDLTSVTIPSSVESIGIDAFSYCSLNKVICERRTPPNGLYVSNSYVAVDLYVPADALTAYYQYSDYFRMILAIGTTTIPPLTFNCGYCGTDACTPTSNVTATLNTETGVMTISGTGQMANFSPYSPYMEEFCAPWFNYGEFITSVVITNGVTSIGEYALNGNFYLKKLTIQDGTGMLSIGSFLGWYRCDTLYLGRNVSGITAGNTFNAVRQVTISNNVTSIPDYAFQPLNGDDAVLTKINIPSSITSIGNFAFSGCTGLTSVSIPNTVTSVTSIGEFAFSGCTGLISVYNYSATPQRISSTVFSQSGGYGVTLYVPAGSVDAYKAAEVWKDFLSIDEIGSAVDPGDPNTAVESQAARQLYVYPNPLVNGALTIDNEEFKAGEDISVYSVNGALVFTGNVSGGSSTTLNLSHLSQGTYIVKIGSRVAKVMKQ